MFSGAPNVKFSENICSEYDLWSRISKIFFVIFDPYNFRFTRPSGGFMNEVPTIYDILGIWIS